MAPPSLAEDRRFARRTLPRVSRTFALNIQVLGGPLAEWVRVGYLLCRAADTLEDAWPGDDGASRFASFLSALEGDPAEANALAGAASAAGSGPELELVAELPRVIRLLESFPAAARAALIDGVRTLASGMSRYASRASSRGPGLAYLDDESELDDYCWVVAGCVGVMLTRLYALAYHSDADARQARRLELAPLVGRALQLSNILLDWPTDVRRGRCYLPADWLAEHGLRPADLVEHDRPEVSWLVRRLEAKALGALARVPDYLDLVPARHLRYRLFCLWPAVWAVRSLRHARADRQFPWGPRRPRLPRQQIYGATIRSLVTAGRGPDLRGELRLVPVTMPPRR